MPGPKIKFTGQVDEWPELRFAVYVRHQRFTIWKKVVDVHLAADAVDVSSVLTRKVDVMILDRDRNLIARQLLPAT